MAMNVFSLFRKPDMCCGAFVLISLVLLATTAHAGFEWVPAKPKAVPPAPVEETPAQPQAQDLLIHEPHSLSPFPPSRDMDESDTGTHTKMPVQAEEKPQPQRVIKVKKMEPPPSVPVPSGITPEDPPIAAKRGKGLRKPAENLVILPEDAPDSARNATKKGQLKISPWPNQASQKGGGTSSMTSESADSYSHKDVKTAQPAADMEQEAVGFGADIPLALALQQIAPAGYAFSFGEGINPGVEVSWSGGKAWSAVMDDMLEPLGLQARIRGNVVFIHHRKESAVIEFESQDDSQSSFGAKALDSSPAPLQQDAGEHVRRNIIQDPGLGPQLQSHETLKALEKLPEPLAQKSKDVSKMHAGIWEAEKGDSLKQTLSKWSKQGAFSLEWNALHDYALQSDVLVAGTTGKALETLLQNAVDLQKGPILTYVSDDENSPGPARLIIDDRKDAAS